MIINSRGKTQKDRKTKRIGDSAPRSPFAASRPSLLKSEATHFGLIRSDLVGFTRINPTDGTTLRRLPPNPSNRACPPLLHSLLLQIPPESIRFTLIWLDLVGFAPPNPAYWKAFKAAPLPPASPVQPAIQAINLPENGLIWSDSVGSARPSAVPTFRPAESAASPASQSGLAHAIGLG